MPRQSGKTNDILPLMLPTTSEMQAIESAAFDRGVKAETLMELAGMGMARVIRSFFPSPQHAMVVCGKGHNAGDVLVAARGLASCGWSIELDLAYQESELAPLTAKKLSELRPALVNPAQPTRFCRRVVLDGLLGIGSSGEPREPVLAAILRINQYREQRHAFVFSADIPSGLDATTGVPSSTCVMADCTVAIAYPKRGVVSDGATAFVGRLAVVPLTDLHPHVAADPAMVLSPSLLRNWLPPRQFDSHKGTWGRVGIIAGSTQYPGAARLCSASAVAGGAGLVTLYVLPEMESVLSIACIPEVMVKRVDSYSQVLGDRLDVLAIGPGLGSLENGAADEILDLIHDAPLPCVVDADGLNALSRSDWMSRKFAAPRLLTPHPVEMNRLVPGTLDQDRRTVAEAFVAANPALTLLLKGARTIFSAAGEPVRFNSTGNPGMGSGGMGDVLTGVAAALIARGLSPIHAGSVAAWVCGRAAEEEIFCHQGSPESLRASDVILNLGAAFQAISTDD